MAQTLTDLKIRKFNPEPHKRVEIWDDRVPAFGLRVSPKRQQVIRSALSA